MCLRLVRQINCFFSTVYISRAVAAIKTSLLFPLVPWLLQLALFAWFVAVAVYP